MSYTLKRVDFINDRAYNEQEHATALFNGLPDFVQEGFDLTGTTITSGRAIVGGVPIKLGNTSETQTITANFTGFLIIKVTLNSFNSNVELIESASQQTSTNTIKYFTIYELVSGAIAQDYRHINYIKDLYFKDLGNDTFSLVINGFESAPFDVSVVQNAYSKTESDDRFLHKTGDNNIVNEATYSNGVVSTIFGSGTYAIRHANSGSTDRFIVYGTTTYLRSPDGSSGFGINDNNPYTFGQRLHSSETPTEDNKYLIASDMPKYLTRRNQSALFKYRFTPDGSNEGYIKMQSETYGGGTCNNLYVNNDSGFGIRYEGWHMEGDGNITSFAGNATGTDSVTTNLQPNGDIKVYNNAEVLYYRDTVNQYHVSGKLESNRSNFGSAAPIMLNSKQAFEAPSALGVNTFVDLSHGGVTATTLSFEYKGFTVQEVALDTREISALIFRKEITIEEVEKELKKEKFKEVVSELERLKKIKEAK